MGNDNACFKEKHKLSVQIPFSQRGTTFVTSSLPSWRMKPLKTKISYTKELLLDGQILSFMSEPPLRGEENERMAE